MQSFTCPLPLDLNCNNMALLFWFCVIKKRKFYVKQKLSILGCVWLYGEDCQFPCSKHCVDQTCDRFNGSCLSWCDSGYYGPKCDQGKMNLD